METTKNNTVRVPLYLLEFAMRLITDHGGSSFEPVVVESLRVVPVHNEQTKHLEHNIL